MKQQKPIAEIAKKEFYTLEEAAIILGVSYPSICNYIRQFRSAFYMTKRHGRKVISHDSVLSFKRIGDKS